MSEYNEMPEYKVNPSKAEDPLVVGTDKYGRYEQDRSMVSDDVLEDQEYGAEGTNFIPIEEVADPDNAVENFEIQDELNLDEVILEEQEPLVPRKKPSEVLINGVPLGDIWTKIWRWKLIRLKISL